MGQYNKAIITAAGESLIARAIVGEIQLSITKAKTSDYKYPGGTDLKALTDMQGIKQIMTSPETKVLSGDMIQTRMLFSNEEVTSTYYIQNIGLYAMDGTQEVLFCIVTAVTPDEMPQYSGVAATAYIYNIQSVVQDAETIHITVNPSGTATIQDVLERVDATGGDISETVIDNLETIDSKYPIPTAGEKVKTFFGKIITFMKNIKPLETDMTVYVATTGSDTTGDGSSLKPFKTIQHAIDTLPKNLGDFRASIFISDGTYDEDVQIVGFCSGEIFIASLSSPAELNTVCNVNSISGRNVTSRLFLNGINSNAATRKAFYLINCTNAIIRWCQAVITNPSNAAFEFDNCSARVEKCGASNYGWALMATYNSQVCINDWSASSTNNTIGITAAHGSVVSLNGSQPAGTTLNMQSLSGSYIIQDNGTQISTVISSGLSCTWGTIQGGYVRHGNMYSGSAMVTIQIGIDPTILLNAGVSYVINGFPKEVIGPVAVTCHMYNYINYCQLYNGQIVFAMKSNFNESRLFFNCTYLTNS